MLSKIYRYLFCFLFYIPSIRKHNGRFTVISPIIFSSNFIELGRNVFIRNFGRIEAIVKYNNEKFKPTISIGDNVSIEQGVHITCAKSIKIKENTAIASNVSITDINHSYVDVNVPIERQNIEVGSVEIGKNCKIYNNVVILPNVVIGNHCVVGANSVVLPGIYESFSIIVGSPAKIVKQYNFIENKWLRYD